MDDHEGLIRQFQGIADTSDDRARFYLESANWELPLALSSFYDNPTAGNDRDDMDVDLPSNPMVVTGNNRLLNPPPNVNPPNFGKPTTQKTKTKSSRFGSIRDLENNDDNSSEEEGQRFYAGGSEHSGELIVGPPRKKKSNDDIAKSLFSEAKKHGAQMVEANSRDAGKSGDSKPKYFGGGGYKLGENEGASEFIPSNNQSSDTGPVNVVLRLWSNGFNVDDGPLRDFNDPSNQEFLNSIKKGEIPRELLKKSRSGEVHVDMEDHREEEFKAQKKKLKPFTGQGHMLGSPAPEFSNSATAMSSSVDPPIVVDKSKPTTTIQIRLSSGKRLRQEFNESHRVSSVRSFIVNSHPDSASRPFVLMTTFPNKELSDENLTLQEAKLLNAVVVQKMV